MCWPHWSFLWRLPARRNAASAAAPTAAQALQLKPVQKDVEYDHARRRRNRKMHDQAGEIRRQNRLGGEEQPPGRCCAIFVDTNADNTVDQWSYYKDGVEVYRDIDSNHNGKADQCRWLNTAGTRWGFDKNEDRTIDVWQMISPEEVSAEVVAALRDADVARFSGC